MRHAHYDSSDVLSETIQEGATTQLLKMLVAVSLMSEAGATSSSRLRDWLSAMPSCMHQGNIEVSCNVMGITPTTMSL